MNPLQLAEQLAGWHYVEDANLTIIDQAATELRRLLAENELLASTAIRACDVAEAGVRSLMEEMGQLRTQRDALLEFARYVTDLDPGNPAPLFVNARAAIKAVGENPHT